MEPFVPEYRADVVVAGAGAAGLCAAVEAAEQGASVIVLDENYDVGGHAIVSGGAIYLGGGTSLQRAHGIDDSPDRIFADLTDSTSDPGSTRSLSALVDRDIVRAFADECPAAHEWLVACGVRFLPTVMGNTAPDGYGHTVPRRTYSAWEEEGTDRSPGTLLRFAGIGAAGGAGLIRPLERRARDLGVRILLETRLTGLVREEPRSGRVTGLTATRDGQPVGFGVSRGVVLATGGHTSNVNFRRIFDPRWTADYNGVAGEPYSRQSADGELAAMAVGASLWAAGLQTLEYLHMGKPPTVIGCQYTYFPWKQGSRAFTLARASGLYARDRQNLIYVNQVGRRFWNEMDHSVAWVRAALARNGGTGNGGGPIWAIFDAEGARREGWELRPPFVDPAGYFFSGASIAELAGRVANHAQRTPLPAAALEETIARYNAAVDAGRDDEHGKPAPKHRIETPPFHAAWAMPAPHDSRTGLRISTRAEVIDLQGAVIPGLYCAGESAAGISQHGLARCIVTGRLAGRHAARERAAAPH